MVVSGRVYLRTRLLNPPFVSDRDQLRNYICFQNSHYYERTDSLSEELMDELIDNFGGGLLLYQNVFNRPGIRRALEDIKTTHVEDLRKTLDLTRAQTFTAASRERFELLEAVAKGDKIPYLGTDEVKYHLTKHGDVRPFLAIRPEGHLILAVPMTREALKSLQPIIKVKSIPFVSNDLFSAI